MDYEVVDTLPGNLNNRRTPLGELNWIFTSITDTIAWTVLPKVCPLPHSNPLKNL